MNQSSDHIHTQSYYDTFVNKLLLDYWCDNPRTIAAIKHALRWIPADVTRIIDIGCGIGWSTREFASHFPKASILGVDLSPQLLDVARQLTDQINVQYQVADFMRDVDKQTGEFGAAVLIDVYEHFPATERAKVHSTLARLLSPDGLVILTFPTPKHQVFLRSKHPEQLQPVDENVTHEDMLHLARDLDGELLYYSEVNIWHKGDYAHAAIARGRNRTKPLRLSHVHLESRTARQSCLRSQLQIEMYAGGLTVPIRTGKTICMVTPLTATSETFIRNQIKYLPFRVCLLHGESFRYDQQGASLLKPNALRFVDPILRYLKISKGSPLLTKIQAQFLRRENAIAVLAQYGTTGVQILPACRMAGIPLFVHFHGFDASVHTVLESHRDAYRNMFEYASGIVAVSKPMKNRLLSLGAPPERLHLNPYGVDPDLFSGGNPEKKEVVFLAVGRFVEKKAPYLTVLAFSKVIEAVPDARLIMVGEGTLLGPCKRLAAALGVGSSVEFLSAQNPLRVCELMRNARAFVQHSLVADNGDCEGTPVAVIEAQMTGLPVVSTRHAGIPDVVVDRETGFIVDEGDADGMGVRMLQLARDPQLAGRMGQAARKRAEAHYTLDRHLNQLAEMIESGVHQKAQLA